MKELQGTQRQWAAAACRANSAYRGRRAARIKRATLATGVSTVLALSVGFALNPTGSSAMAADRFTMVKRQIVQDGQVMSNPYSFVYGGTTYMPVWYVMHALTQAKVVNQWDGKTWNISFAHFTPSSAVGNGTVQVVVNGTLVDRVTKIVTLDPASNQPTTFIPIYSIMQVLKAAGIQNSWDGTHWNMPSTMSNAATGSAGSTTGSGTGSGGSNASTGSSTVPPTQTLASLVGTRVQNQATPDQAFWQRAGNNLYIYGTTYDPSQASQGTESMMNIQPGQTVYLFVYSSKINVGQVQWSVNSPNATVTSAAANQTWTIDKHNAAGFQFVAQKPGIYTLQASTNGEYSVPYVLTVGLSQLSGSNIATSAGQSGILPLPANLPSTLWSTGAWPSTPISAASGGGRQSGSLPPASSAANGIFYKQYAPIHGWVPVYGQVTTPGLTSVVVDFSNSNSTQEQNYTLPVHADGTFGALLEVPISGSVNVAIVPDFLKELTTQNMQGFYNNVYSVNNTAPTLTQQQQGLLASATMDYNLTPAMNQVASVLMENAPSMDSGVAAVANYVGDKVLYDWVGFNANTNVWQNSSEVWLSNSGVCQDIAELTASMLKSVGVPTLTVMGTAPKNQTPDDHEWIQAWDGTGWLTIDPTWNSPSNAQSTVNDTLSNEYMTLTDSFQTSHTTDTNKIGTWQ